MRQIIILLCVLSLSKFSKGQVTVAKLLGKDASTYGVGYGLFAFYDFTVNDDKNSIRLELMDIVLFGSKGGDVFSQANGTAKGSFSARVGYKYIFSDTKTGFYALPSIGYCRTMFSPEIGEGIWSNGVAFAFEGGYQIEVGQRGNYINAGLKYGYDHTKTTELRLQSLALRLYYSFGLHKRRD